MSTIDSEVINHFGAEWKRFNQSSFIQSEEGVASFNKYFNIFPWDSINEGSEGFDLGCGTGRWAFHVASRVKTLNCIEPSAAIEVAKENLKSFKNCVFHKASSHSIPLMNNSQDFGYCLGVLHHVTDTFSGLVNCAKKLKPGALFYFIYTTRLIISPFGLKLFGFLLT